MNNVRSVLRALPAYLAGIASKMNVKLVIGGNRCCTNGEVVYLPSLPMPAGGQEDLDYLRQVKDLAIGQVLHEACHLRLTDFNKQEHAEAYGEKMTPPVFGFVNALEDIRIEREMAKQWPGLTGMMDAMNVVLKELGYLAGLGDEAQHPAMALGYHVHYALRRSVLGNKGLDEVADKIRDNVNARFGKPFVTMVEGMASQVVDCQSTTDVIKLSRRIILAIEQEAQERKEQQAQQEQQQQGDRQDGDQGQDGSDTDQGDQGQDGSGTDQGGEDSQDGDASQSSQDTGSDDNQGDQGQDGSGADQDDDGSSDQDGSQAGASQDSDGSQDGGGDQSNQDTGKNQDGSQAGDDSTDQGDSASAGQDGSGAGDSKAQLEAIEQVLDADEDQVTPHMDEQVAKLLEQMCSEDEALEHGCSTQGGTQYLEVEDRPGNAGVNRLANLGPATASIAGRVARYLNTQGMRESRLDNRGRRVSGRHLANAVTTGRVFQRRRREEVGDTLVEILLDRSGSMHHQIGLALDATAAIGAALETLPGVTVGITAFPDIVPVVVPGERVRSQASRINLAVDGGTPMGDALWWVGGRAMGLSQRRKIILTITDGEPNDRQTLYQAIVGLRQQGIQLLAIGLDTSPHGCMSMFDAHATVDGIEDLAQAMFEILAPHLTVSAA